MDLILVEKSCRDDGCLETEPAGDSVYRFFSSFHDVDGAFYIRDGAVRVEFGDQAAHERLRAHLTPAHLGVTEAGALAWCISDLEAYHGFWQGVREVASKLPKPSWPPEDFDPDKDDDARTEEESVQKVRRGQEIYRERLEKLWQGGCAVTGVTTWELLRASHAKPWKDCLSSRERLDPYNGFLLNVTLDALFDADLISFDDDGGILLNPSLSARELAAIGVSDRMRLRFIHQRHRPFLALQRERFRAKSGDTAVESRTGRDRSR